VKGKDFSPLKRIGRTEAIALIKQGYKKGNEL
jgi:hypothetical protein